MKPSERIKEIRDEAGTNQVGDSVTYYYKISESEAIIRYLDEQHANPNTKTQMNREEMNREFHAKFGNIWEYTQEHTDWWLDKQSQLLHSLIVEIEGLIKYTDEELNELNKDLPSTLQEQALYQSQGMRQMNKDIINLIKKYL